MKKTALIAIVALIMLPIGAFANDLYTAKCQSCHGPDGKKSAKVDLTSETIQAKSDADLVKFLTTNGVHKSKVASEDDAKAVVAFIRTLKK